MKDDRYKSRIDGEFSELDYVTRHGFWYAAKWVAASIVAILLMVGTLWFTGVLFAGPKGAGDAYKTNQSGTNRIAKQEMFEQLYQDIQVADLNVDATYVIQLTDPSYVNKTNYLAAKQQCNQLVGNYNAEARKYTSADWRDNKLPSAINQEDPKFDCKEEKKK